MFTGIIEEVGTVSRITPSGSGVRITLEAEIVIKDISIGASIAVNGCCLTVTEYDNTSWSADAVPETMSRTNLGTLALGSKVNLERPLKSEGRFGGHVVQGHVDCTTYIANISNEDDGSYRYEFDLSNEWGRYVCEKGSIAIDGISLTVASVSDDSFSVAIIPHTWGGTNLNQKSVGDLVNIEVDILAKYIERQLNYNEKETTIND